MALRSSSTRAWTVVRSWTNLNLRRSVAPCHDTPPHLACPISPLPSPPSPPPSSPLPSPLSPLPSPGPWSLAPGPWYLARVAEEKTTEALEALRRAVDELDARIVELLAERSELSSQIGRAKLGNGDAVYAPAREADVLERVTRLAGGRIRPQHLRAIYGEILSASRDLQRPPRIAFLGPKATF